MVDLEISSVKSLPLWRQAKYLPYSVLYLQTSLSCIGILHLSLTTWPNEETYSDVPQSHRATEWQNWDFNLGSSGCQKSSFFPFLTLKNWVITYKPQSVHSWMNSHICINPHNHHQTQTEHCWLQENYLMLLPVNTSLSKSEVITALMFASSMISFAYY